MGLELFNKHYLLKLLASMCDFTLENVMGLFHSGDISGAIIIFNNMYSYIFSEHIIFIIASPFRLLAETRKERETDRLGLFGLF
jgi:hypothetical protein